MKSKSFVGDLEIMQTDAEIQLGEILVEHAKTRNGIKETKYFPVL